MNMTKVNCRVCGKAVARIVARANDARCADCAKTNPLATEMDRLARLGKPEPEQAMRGLLKIAPDAPELTPELNRRREAGIAAVGAILQAKTGQPVDGNPLVAAAQMLGGRLLPERSDGDPEFAEPDEYGARRALAWAGKLEAEGHRDDAWMALDAMRAMMTPAQRVRYDNGMADAVSEVNRQARLI